MEKYKSCIGKVVDFSSNTQYSFGSKTGRPLSWLNDHNLMCWWITC